MIQIDNKYNCCGCNACVQKCPMQCITMHEDEEGFFYPFVDESKCVDCHLCEKVCPCINQLEPKKPLVCYAAKNNDKDICRQSSSGGVFTAIAEKVLVNKGVVFGAKFDKKWQVVHACAETVNDLFFFRGSKYVQSNVGYTFKKVEVLLKEGRNVLFSGTPCQISALNHFLNKGYDNLYTIEVVCHGVSSPKVWHEYLISLQLANIATISHKDKSTGWRGYSFTIKDAVGNILLTEKASDNKFLMAFVRNLIIRPSCFSCPAKAGKSRADITLADYWGIENILPDMDDSEGISFICVNTEKGKILLKNLNLYMRNTDYDNSIQYNSCIFKSTDEPEARKLFWKKYRESGINALFLLKKNKQNIFKRIIKRILR